MKSQTLAKKKGAGEEAVCINTSQYQRENLVLDSCQKLTQWSGYLLSTHGSSTRTA